MSNRIISLKIVFCAAFMAVASGADAQAVRHRLVASEAGAYYAWPAREGAWIWGNQILVVFAACEFQVFPGEMHNCGAERPRMQARSLDGGDTWSVEVINQVADPTPTAAIDFKNPGFAMRFWKGRNAFWYTYDYGKTWFGERFMNVPGISGLPTSGVKTVTDVIVESSTTMKIQSTAYLDNEFGDRAMMVETTDGARTFNFKGWIARRPPPGCGAAYMPSTVNISTGTYVSVVRKELGCDASPPIKRMDDVYKTTDNGATWTEISRPVSDINTPASMVKLGDGRLVVIYGNRPAGTIEAKISTSGGASWGSPVTLRSGGVYDTGYPRALLKSNGEIVVMYYWSNPVPQGQTPQASRIEATIWKP